jgi:hypothetical protein
MRSAKIALSAFLLFPIVCSSNAYAGAKDDDGKEPAVKEGKDGAGEEDTPAKAEGADIRVQGKDREKELDPGEIERAKQAEMADSPVELPGKTYYFVGLRYRGMLVPKFMMNLFGDGGTSVYVHGIGPEFTVRKDNFEYVLSAWWAGYNMDPTLFKASSDPDTAYEYVKTSLNVLYLTSDFNWTTQIDPMFGFNFGIGAGFGFVWGDLIRNQAYPNGNGGWATCEGDPAYPAHAKDTHNGYCGTDNHHYNNYKEPSWANGGSKPIVFPWLALQTGVRIKPHRNVMARIDLGWAITGPFFGISGNYGL